MVIIANYSKTEELNIPQEYLDWYKFELSPFQKWSINALINGNNSLITAHTGSGKTIPAEFGIRYFTSQGKRVIYTTPIKALSNQKLFDFRRKYPEISFGILTGDIEDNRDAQVLIMTTEILANTLMSRNVDKHLSSQLECDKKPEGGLRFEMNFETDLALVVFDEVHYIADQDRGHAWEQSIILLPNNVQLLMLSATISEPEQFALWIENKYLNENAENKKQVVLSSTNERVVPLKHYAWFAPFKSKDMQLLASKPTTYQMVDSNTNKLITLRNGDSRFLETNYSNILKLKNYINLSSSKDCFTDHYVLTHLIDFLKKNKMLPALCFLFSRNQVETLANIIAKSGKINLFDENDEVTPIKIQKECRHILSSKLNNYLDYINLPEYSNILSLLEKGIGIHHAGVLPILRELIEILDEKGYIKLLFATETFAVGVNMPTKTVIFKSIKKFSNNVYRYVHPFEYTQMAGRAGRRGLDTVGHVILLCNLFELPSSNDMSNILVGSPQTIKSNFHLSYNVILNTLYKINNLENNENKENNYDILISLLNEFCLKSLIQPELKHELEYLTKTFTKLSTQNSVIINTLQTPIDIINKYKDLSYCWSNCHHKQKKTKLDEINALMREYKCLQTDLEFYNQHLEIEKELDDIALKINNVKEYFTNEIKYTLQCLKNENFINEIEPNKYIITRKGQYASHIQEAHPLALAEFLEKNSYFKEFESKKEAASLLCGFLSMFASISIPDDYKVYANDIKNTYLRNYANDIQDYYEKYFNSEIENIGYQISQDYKLTFDICEPILQWCEANDNQTCQGILLELNSYEIFTGDYIKAILKIVKMCKELEKPAQDLMDYDFLQILNYVPECLLKYIATNQSLYI